MPRAVLLAVFAWLPVLSSAALPSIVHMLCDDCGWGDFGYQGTNAKHVMTPNIDALAADAHTLQLSRYHTEITCTPSRHSIVTGRSPLRDCCVGAPIGDNPIWGPATPFVVQVAKNAGYQTVQLGKWQEGARALCAMLACDDERANRHVRARAHVHSQQHDGRQHQVALGGGV